MNATEKMTVNLNAVDLGKIDLLIKQGFFSNRTDFIKLAIRKELDFHQIVVSDIIVKDNLTLGVVAYSKLNLEKLLSNNEKINIRVVGMLIIKEDVSLELALNVINSIYINGVFRANKILKNNLNILSKNQ